MYALTIDNPEIAKLAKEVFSKEPISTNADFYDSEQRQIKILLIYRYNQPMLK